MVARWNWRFGWNTARERVQAALHFKLAKPLFASTLALLGYATFRLSNAAWCEPKLPGCVDPVCSSKMDMFQKAINSQKHGKSATNSSGVQNRNESQQEAATGNTNAYVSGGFSRSDCPIDRAELGRSTWQLIHTLSAYFPDEPTPAQQEAAKQLITSLSLLYPCHICQPHFQEFVRSVPPRCSTREEFSLWCCELHNAVNRDLGLPEKPCEIQQLDMRWKVGDASCWTQQGAEKPQ